MPHDPSPSKQALRASIRARRRQLSDAQRAVSADGFTAQLDALVETLAARTITCFAPTGTEPDVSAFIERALARGIRVMLPLSRPDGLLEWAEANGEAARVGLFGIREPDGAALPPAALDDVDLMLIPAAAVDRGGTRLGWGRGYFDRTLATRRTQPPVYAVIYDSEVVDSLPREGHDQPVTGVVTETRILTLSPRRP